MSYDSPTDGSLRSGSESGFILIAVIGALALLSVLILTLASVVRLDIKAKSNLLRRIELENQADGLVRLVALRLTQSRAAQRLLVDGRQIGCRLDGSSALFSVRDVAGLIDINAVTAGVLERVLRNVGLTAEQAVSLAAAIVDFRDADDDVTPGGAETDAYRAASMPHMPKNGPFETVMELDQVLGMNPQLLAKLQHVFTVHSRLPGIDLGVASLPVLLALSEIQAPEATGPDAFAQRREVLRQTFGSGTRSNFMTYTIEVTVRREQAASFSRQATIEITPRSFYGFVFKDWSAVASADPPNQAPSEATFNCLDLTQVGEVQ